MQLLDGNLRSKSSIDGSVTVFQEDSVSRPCGFARFFILQNKNVFSLSQIAPDNGKRVLL